MLGNGPQQLLLRQPRAREESIRIAIRSIAQHRHDNVSPAQLLGNLLGRDDVERGAGAQVQPLLVQAPVHHLDALLVRDGQRPVQQVNVRLQVVRDAALADALGDAGAGPLDQLAARGNVRVQHAAGGVCKEALDAAAGDVLEISRRASKSPSSAGRAGEGVHLAARLRPYLGPRRLDVRAAVGRVVELVRPDGVVQGLGMPLRLVVVVLRVVKRHGRHGIHLGAQQPQQVNLALRLRVGHVDDQLVASRAADVRQANARVAGSALDDGAARLQEASLFGILDDVESGPVLDGAAGVHELGLAQDLAAGLFRQTVEADQRRVSNGCA